MRDEMKLFVDIRESGPEGCPRRLAFIDRGCETSENPAYGTLCDLVRDCEGIPRIKKILSRVHSASRSLPRLTLRMAPVKYGLAMRALLFSLGLAGMFSTWGSCAGAQGAALPPDTSFNSSAGRGDLIWIKLTSGASEEYNFGIDTGATLTVLDKSWNDKLEPRQSKTIVGARWPISGIFAPPTLYLGGVRLLTGDRIVTEDLAAHFPGRSVAGILGMDCLGHYCLQFDFAQNMLRFVDSSRLGEQDLGKAFPIEPVRGCFFVNDNVAGAEGFRSLIDTGCNFDGVLIPQIFQQWTNQPESAPSTPATGVHYPDGIFGGVTYSTLYLAGDGQQNLVGLHFLARNLVTLNFPGHMMYLQQRTTGPLPSEKDYFRGFYKNTFRTR